MREVVRNQNNGPAQETSNSEHSGSTLTQGSGEHALSKIDISGSSLTAAMHSGLGIASPFTREIFLKERLPIVGMRYQGGSLDLVKDIQMGSRITFMREPENQYDKKAIMALDGQDRKLGYIPRSENEILSALMDAGKTLYGIVSHVPAPGELRNYGPPTVLYVDLHMREFASADNMSHIPRQGYRGSYVVMDLELTEEEDQKIQSVFAVRVINGEERGIFSEEVSEDHYEQLVRDLREAVGYLPVVLCDDSLRQQKALERGWGIYAGRPFSNQVIEICEMARNHLNMVSAPSLEGMVQRLEIKAEGDTEAELRCRQIWQIYCRFDRSALERKADPVTQALTKKKYVVKLDTQISKLKMTGQLRETLVEHDVDILWEISVLSRSEVRNYVGSDGISELEELLYMAGSGFKPEDCFDPLYGYPRSVQKIAKDKGDYWRCFLFFAIYRFRYLQLSRTRKQGEKLWRYEKTAFPVRTTSVLGAFLKSELDTVRGWIRNINIRTDLLGKASTCEDDQECISETVSATEGLICLYKEMMVFKRRYRYVDADESFRELIEDFVQLGEQLCQCFADGLYRKCTLAEKALEDYIEGGKRGAVPELDLSLDLTVDMDDINQKIDQLTV